MEREWRIWLGFCAVVVVAVMFVLGRNDDSDPSELSAGTTLPTSTTVAPSTTVTTQPTTTSTSSSSTSTTPASTAPPTTRRVTAPTTEDTVADTTPTTAVPTTPPTTEPAFRIQFVEGTYRIGIDLPAGTYRTDGGPFCFWARLSSLSGTADSVIASENTNGAAATVTIPASDNAFYTSGCAVWTSV